MEWKKKQKNFYSDNDQLIKFHGFLKGKVTFHSIHILYKALKQIGKGCSGNVILVEDIASKSKYAVKCIDKKYTNKSAEGIVLII